MDSEPNPYAPPSAAGVAPSSAKVDRDLGVRLIGYATLALLAVHVALGWTTELLAPPGSHIPGMNPSIDELLAVVGTVSSLARLGGTLAFFGWSYEAASRAYALQRPGMTISPGWFIGWYFIPFAMLVMPYRAVRQLSMASDPEGRGVAPLHVLVWWLLFLASFGWPLVALALDLSHARAVVELGRLALLTADLVALYVTMRFVHRGQAFWTQAATIESAQTGSNTSTLAS